MIQNKTVTKKLIIIACAALIAFFPAWIFTGNPLLSLLIGMVNMILQVVLLNSFPTVWHKGPGRSPNPAVIFFTGLSGSGKTTVARALIIKLQQRGIEPVFLDGDEIRQAIKQTGFDEQSRKNHNLNVGYMASILEAQGHFVVVALIAPYEETRNTIRKMCKNFKEIYVATPLEVCISRDTKGLYQKAVKGEIQEFTGISAPYSPPKYPEVIINTARQSVDESVGLILKALDTNS
ncbi:MAG: adenylyl-sulfate kinase [Bacteroidota bacterium]